MAESLKPLTIAAPGFYGINTQDSPIEGAANYASIALNCVMDKFGRIGARKGYEYITTDSTPLGASIGIQSLGEFQDEAGNTIIFSTGNNRIFQGTTTLTNVTPGGYSITGDDWQMINFNGTMTMWQRNHEPLIYDTASAVVAPMSSHANAVGTAPQGNCALAAFGRMWVADTLADKSTLTWSDLLLPMAFSGGSSGSIDLRTAWPTGYDKVTAIAEHNNYLIIFGERSILIYEGADDPATMEKVDAITGIGCVSRDSVQGTGADILFLSHRGIQSLGRVIQEKSAPIGNPSRNVTNDLVEALAIESSPIHSVYSEEEGFYLLVMPDDNYVYCFDTRLPLENGAYRTTLWSGMGVRTALRRYDGSIVLGLKEGIANYSGYYDDGETYQLEYFSNPLSLDTPANLKFLKRFAITLIGGSNTDVHMLWGYDYKLTYHKHNFTIKSADVSEYGIAEYGENEYSAGIVISEPNVNASGSGSVITIGIQAEVNGTALSIQKIDMLTLIGRLI